VLAKPPAPQTLVGSFVGRPRFTASVTAADKGKGLRLQRSLQLPALRVEPAVYPAFAEFCRRVDEVEGRELFLQAAH
jgi:hypothetical protein